MSRANTAEKTEGGAAVATVDKPDDGLETKAAREALVDLATKFNKAYRPLLAKALEMAEMTSAIAWQQLYAGRRAGFKTHRLGIAEEIERIANQMKQTGNLTPDEIKHAKDMLKSYEENRDAEAAFDRTTVAGVRDAAERCASTVEGILGEAQTVERSNALQLRGLASAIAAEVKLHAQVKWDADTGQIVIG